MAPRLTRGEIWTVAGRESYTNKPRPAVILQDDRFDGTDSITLCGLTTDPTEAFWFRLVIEPSDANGLRSTSSLMVDKITTVPRSKLGRHVGRLDDTDMLRISRAIVTFLGLVGA